MVIGAVCREYGVEAHADRTAVIARVLTARPITPDEVLKYDDPTSAGQDVAKQLGLGDESDEADCAGASGWSGGSASCSADSATSSRTARAAVSAARFIGRLPAVGLVGGYFDERKGIRKAAYAAADLLASSAFRVKPI